MELLASSMPWPSYVLLTSLFLLLIATQLRKPKRGKAAPLPPGPRRFPIIGNLHNLSGAELAHQRLAELSREHGPMMHLQMGQTSMVVVSSRDVAQAFLKTHDLNFADRPTLQAFREMAYNGQGMALSTYGDRWRTMKKMAVIELLTAKRVASFSQVREEAVSKILSSVAEAGSEPVNLSKIFYLVGHWTVSQAAFGSANSKHQLDYVVDIMNEILALATGLNLADFFPVFETPISAITGMKRKMQKVFLKMDAVLTDIINEHMSRLDAGDGQNEEGQDILDLLLRHYRLQDLEVPLSINNVKGVLQDLFIAGTDTSSSTLEWAMTELMKNPDVMHKAQSEVRRVYREKGKIDESVIGELSYLKLVVKETLRLHPPSPLLLPRQCRETCEINGYRIPVKTRVVINAWALGRDPMYWEKPNEFYPERFLDGSVDYKGTNYEYVPFGAGRRMCPGATFALANVDLTLAKILCHFDWKLPVGMGPDDLNMEETEGAIIHKKVPLCLLASAHIPI